MLVAIQDRLLGLSLYRNIYKEHHGLDQQIQSKIVITYNSFVQFCTAVVDYYDLGCFRGSFPIQIAMIPQSQGANGCFG